MLTEGLGIALEKGAEIAVGASEVAELGAVKPEGFGSLIRERLAAETVRPRIDGTGLSEFLRSRNLVELFGKDETQENPYLSLRYNEVSKECSEYLCDCDITPDRWLNADSEQRMEMLKTATKIMANELKLPDEWTAAIEPTAVSGEPNMASANCRIIKLGNGGVDIVGVPDLNINVDYLTDDYYEAMATIYHEMIHVKQYASIDCIAPETTTDSRLLDLINDMKSSDGNFTSYVNYLYSPYEAEAWAQEAYFKKMLEAVVTERYS